MIYDSEEQKIFIIKAIKQYTCTIQEAVDLMQRILPSIEKGEVRPPAPQKETTSQEVKN